MLKKQRATIENHFNIAQLRVDTWVSLSRIAERLVVVDESTVDMTQLNAFIDECLDVLSPVERYYEYPRMAAFSELRRLFSSREYDAFAREVSRTARAVATDSYKAAFGGDAVSEMEPRLPSMPPDRHHFAVLIVENLTPQKEEELRSRLAACRDVVDEFIYDLVVVPSFEDALNAVMINANIQSCVIRYEFPIKSETPLPLLKPYTEGVEELNFDERIDDDRGPALGRAISKLRPDLDLFLVTDASVEAIAGHVQYTFNRVFYGQNNYLELHLSILEGVKSRYRTPFFSISKAHSQRPVGTFHALPIARGNSVYRSKWIQDMGDFYGKNIFLSESSATTGGLDSLLEPEGNLLEAQKLAATTFGANATYYCTNGTSTANKIVCQAIVEPGDIVLIDRNCHKSHHYGMVLGGGCPIYLDAYPIEPYSIYGAVPMTEIKAKLLHLREQGRLAKAKMVLLTNCTFDGHVYRVEKVMTEILAIKPDIVFLWDEAWMAYARFTPMLRQRTAMNAARNLLERFRSERYRAQYAEYTQTTFDPMEDGHIPDPDLVRVRVYATQSTHKSLSSFRQGSMIHVYDQDFAKRSQATFEEAYMTHTSTSPSHPIMASLDLARRQVQFEGYELVQGQIETALMARDAINDDPLLSRYFKVLTPEDLIPEEHRGSGLRDYDNRALVEQAWRDDEFVLDPTRCTLYIAETGMNGATFRSVLMDRFGIQVNKTSINTVLFMTTIGTTRSAVAYLLQSLTAIANEIEREKEVWSPQELELFQKSVQNLTASSLPPLPDFSHFHERFRPNISTPEGEIRMAFFMAYKPELCEYVPLEEMRAAVESGRERVSSTFVIPYPPGFPVLVPGQVVSSEILAFMVRLDVKEIHGYDARFGFRVFTEEALALREDV